MMQAMRLAALALVVALSAQAAGPAIAATMLVRQEVPAGHAAEPGHHHPGCPWRERGPCPHEAVPEGPVLTSCDAPAAAAATPAPPAVATSPGQEALLPPPAFAASPFPPADRAGRPASRLLDPPPPRDLSPV